MPRWHRPRLLAVSHPGRLEIELEIQVIDMGQRLAHLSKCLQPDLVDVSFIQHIHAPLMATGTATPLHSFALIP